MIADDHVLIRQVVREVVEREQDLEVVAEAADGHEAAQRAAETHPDVVLMDLTMPVCDGFEATERVLACSPCSRVVIFSASDQDQHILQAFQRGAIGYITKDVRPEDLINAIRRASRDELFMIGPLAGRLLGLFRTLTLTPPVEKVLPKVRKKRIQRSTKNVERPVRLHTRVRGKSGKTIKNGKPTKLNLPLTRREEQVLTLMRQGQRNREIALALEIAESTVHKHIQNIFEKLDAHNRSEAVFLAK
jgi:DNA-binding NarL/FixJ family response regulator